MKPWVVPIAIAVGGNVLYHVSQKSIPASAPPLLSLLVSYAVAIAGTLMLLPFAKRNGTLVEGFGRLNWASVGVGIAIVGVELGFLLAYRAGWNVSAGSVAVNVALGLLLIPVGVLLFRERLSAVNVAGIALCIVGLILVSRR